MYLLHLDLLNQVSEWLLKYCFVPSCSNNSKTNPKKIYVRIPANMEVRKTWYEAVFPDLSQIDITKTSMLFCCEDHFDMENDCENWMQYKLLYTKLQMKKDAVPHKNLNVCENSTKESQLSPSSKKRKQEVLLGFHSRKKLIIDDMSTQSTSFIPIPSLVLPSTSSSISIPPPSLPSCIELNLETGKMYMSEGTQDNLEQTKPDVRNAETQVNFFNLKLLRLKKKQVSPVKSETTELLSSPSTASVRSSDIYNSPSSSSNSEEEKILKEQQKQKNISVSVINVENHSRFYLGLIEEEYFILKLLIEEINIRYEWLLITLKKIRLNDPYHRLGIEFGYSIATIGHIFTSSVPIIANVMQEFVHWPTEFIIKMHLPMPFVTRYKNVQSIIDCLEVQIQQPTNAVNQAQTWSQYKKCNTIKYLISSTPFGLINFISVGYGGRASDKEIMENSGFISHLPENCAVMADRGFKNIEHLLTTKNCHLVRPPSVSADEKMTKEKVLESKKIAALRIHIERVIRRLREFEILAPHACVNSKLVVLLDYIIIIVCGIVNLQGPLIK